MPIRSERRTSSSGRTRRATKAADPVREGREAFRSRHWAAAWARLSEADRAAPLGIDDLELLATSAYLIGKDELSDDLWIRAHNECVRLHNVPRAARCTFWLVLDLLNRGEAARASGWLGRAHRLLDEGKHDCPDRGLLLVLASRLYMKQGDLQSVADAAGQAVALSGRFDDPELKVFSRLALGLALARRGDTAGAVALFDEVMVGVTVGDVSPVAVGVVYCAVIDACHHILDIGRAREWTAELSRWCTSQPDLVPFRGQCLVHRAEIMRLSGAWPQAMAEAEHACAWLSELAEKLEPPAGGQVLPAFKYPIGAAFYELGEIHRLRGDLARAADAYRRASRHGRAPEPGMALLRMAQGRLKVAVAAIRRVAAQPQNRFTRATVLAACVEIMLAAGDKPAARAAADELGVMADETAAPFVRALHAQARGAVQLADGDAHAAIATLRTAWKLWQDIEAPYDAARARVLLGLACREFGDVDAVELELDAARRVFEQLGAVPDVERVGRLLKPAPAAGAQALTPRELQVIGLVATGKTNRAIAKHLSISERTVDRHVSNILMKLSLPSRSAATAYAYEHGLV
jgi:DNA-binding CsgD family transcriptional regulator